jgi:hypothetical protein
LLNVRSAVKIPDSGDASPVVPPFVYPPMTGLSQLTGDVTQRSHLFGVQ